MRSNLLPVCNPEATFQVNVISNPTLMILNFFKTAWRNILKHQAYSAINLVGLTSGLAVSLLILAYVRHEVSYDSFHEKAKRLYRLSYIVPNGLRIAVTPPPIAPLMGQYFPGVENAARVYRRSISIRQTTGATSQSYEEQDVLFADSALMNMMTFSFVAGNPALALKEPFTLLITEETAKKYFGDRDPMGESLDLGGRQSFKITAVVRNLPENSHIRFNMLVPYDNMYDLETDAAEQLMRRNLESNFVISHSYTYVLLKPGASPADVDAAMPAFIKKYAPANRQIGQKFTMMPLGDIHLRSSLLMEPTPPNSMTTIYIFGAIGILTLLIACINYVNLSTAQSLTRIKEIGVRKILGSARKELIIQFMAESFLFCLFAFALSYVIFYFGLPLLSLVTGTNLRFAEVADGFLILSSVGLLAIVTLLAGGYPAWFVSRFNSVASLKGEKAGSMGGSHLLRKSLVVFQLMIAGMLLSGSMMLIKQLNYLNDRPLGFKKEHVLTIPLFSQNLNAIFERADSAFRYRIQTFRDRAERLSNVEGTTMSSASPGLGTIYRGAIPEGMTAEDNLFIADLGIDYDFVNAFGIEMRAGRALSRNYGTDENEGFMVNEAAVREFHWGTPEQAIGKTLNREGKKGKVIGVVKDFNMASLTTPISALIMEISPDQWSAISIKIRNNDVKATVESLKKDWNQLFPEKTFEYTFLDEQLREQYSNFVNFGTIIEGFTGIAMIISCLGVYGLVLFVVRKKVKEIGIRKVLGAHTGTIVTLIFREFILLILIGFVLAIPASWYFVGQWLENFTFHTSIDGVTYVLSFVLIVVIVSVTISYHAIRAAVANPVLSLRSE